MSDHSKSKRRQNTASGGLTHGRLTSLGNRCENLADVVFEPGVEHPVRLVQNEVRDPRNGKGGALVKSHQLLAIEKRYSLAQAEGLVVQHVDKSTGSSDDDPDTLLAQQRLLLLLRSASVDADALGLEGLGNGGEGFPGLDGEFSGGGDDEDAGGGLLRGGRLGELGEVFKSGDLAMKGIVSLC